MRQSERGDSRIGTVIWMAIFAAIIYASWHVLPVYLGHFSLADKCNELARSPRHSHPDERIVELVWKEAYEQKLQDYIKKEDIKIDTQATGRRIMFKYDVELQILPGWRKVVTFEVKSDQPLL